MFINIKLLQKINTKENKGIEQIHICNPVPGIAFFFFDLPILQLFLLCSVLFAPPKS